MNMKYERQIRREDAEKLFVEYENTRDPELRDILIERHLYIPTILSRKYGLTNRAHECFLQVKNPHFCKLFSPRCRWGFLALQTLINVRPKSILELNPIWIDRVH